MTITLIGMPGAGKSTVGQTLAETLKFDFIDTDRLIEEYACRPLQMILDQGVDGFRALEETIILGLAGPGDSIIATGGSVVYSDAAMRHLRSFSTVIHLSAPLELIRRRLEHGASRGVVGLAQKGLLAIYNERLPLYERYSELTVDVAHKTVRDIVLELGQSVLTKTPKSC